MSTRRFLLIGALIGALLFFGASSAHAEGVDVYGETPPQVLSSSDSNTAPVVEETATEAAVEASSLPVTGGDIAGLTAIGAGSVLLGAALITYRRRQGRA